MELHKNYIVSGIEEALIITGRNKKSIEDSFDRSIELEKAGKQEMFNMVRKISNMVNVHFIRQKQSRGCCL